MTAGSLLAVVNPAAGGGRCGRRAAAAISDLRSAGLAVEVAETSRPGEATEVTRHAWRAGQRRFVAVGGDGTGYEIVNGLFPEAEGAFEGDRPSLGFLPLGTGNSFLRDFTVEGERHAIGALKAGRHRPCDVIRLQHADGGLHYINILSIGFVADVNGLRQRRFRALGELGYVAAVVVEVAGLDPRVFPMRFDGGAREQRPAVFYSFNNSRYTGGAMMMAPHADTADGWVDVIRVEAMGRLALLRAFPRIFRGTHLAIPQVSELKAQVVDFMSEDEVDVMVDGEALRLVPKRLEVLPGALDVCV